MKRIYLHWAMYKLHILKLIFNASPYTPTCAYNLQSTHYTSLVSKTVNFAIYTSNNFAGVRYNWESIKAVWKIHQFMSKVWCKKWFSKLFTSTTFSDAASVINADTHTSATYNHKPKHNISKIPQNLSISTITYIFHSQNMPRVHHKLAWKYSNLTWKLHSRTSKDERG